MSDALGSAPCLNCRNEGSVVGGVCLACGVMTRRQQLLQLRERLKKATGPDRLLDYDLWCAIKGYVVASPETKTTHGLLKSDDKDSMYTFEVPALTKSIDAAETLEGASPYVEVIRRPDGTFCVSWFGFRVGREIRVIGSTEPLARCLARIEYELANLEGES